MRSTSAVTVLSRSAPHRECRRGLLGTLLAGVVAMAGARLVSPQPAAAEDMTAELASKGAELARKLNEAKLTLADAVTRAEKHGQGTAVAACVWPRSADLRVRVWCVEADGDAVMLDVPAQGDVAPAADAKVPKSSPEQRAKHKKQIDAARKGTSLLEAIAAAERESKGTCLMIEGKLRSERLVYETASFAGGRLMNVEVDGASGKPSKARAESQPAASQPKP